MSVYGKTTQRLLLFPPPPLTALTLWLYYRSRLGGSGISTWITTLFVEIGLSNPYGDSFFYAAVGLPANIVALVVIDRLDRRHTLAAALTMAGVSISVFAFNVKHAHAALVLPAAGAYTTFIALSWIAVSWSLTDISSDAATFCI